MKRFWLSIMAALLVVAVAAPAMAWEFSMNGEFEFRLRYFNRMGSADLWGDANVQESAALSLYDSAAGFWFNPSAGTPATAGGPNAYQNAIPLAAPGVARIQNFVGFAGPNIYMTGYRGPANTAGALVNISSTGSAERITRGGFSRFGADALYNDVRLTLHPVIRVNPAIRVHGVYTIGGYRNKYVQNDRDARAQLSDGAPPFERYYQASSSTSAYNTAAVGSWEQVRATIQYPLGTMSIGIKDFPFGTGIYFSQNTRSDCFVNIIPYGPFRFINGVYLAEGSALNGTSVAMSAVPDKDTKPTVYLGQLIDYNQGPLNAGIGVLYQQTHLNAYQAALLTAAGDPISTGSLGWDVVWTRWDAALKYNNGRFFLNAEYYWSNRDYTRLGAHPVYREGYLSWVNGGVLAGPVKFDLVWAQASGQPRHGSAGFDNRTRVGLIENINYQAMKPYQFLMFETYAGGNNQFNADGTGQMGDAIALGGRLDYAVAANLNMFGSFLYAKRLERNGDYAGSYNTGITAAGATSVSATSASVGTAQNWKAAVTGIAGLNPYVDDNLIGWEAQGGVDWKILEGMTWNVSYAYWQPGPWFNQAYRAVTGSLAGLQGGDMWMSDRSAIQSLRSSFVIDF